LQGVADADRADRPVFDPAKEMMVESA